MNIPIILTLVRIAAIPVFVLVHFAPFSWSHVASAVIFAVAGITDWLDGYLARRLQQMSAFGAFLDPVADKLMVAVALVLLVQDDPDPWLAVVAAIIIGREITISALREWMAEIGRRSHVKVASIGKFKTVLQMFAIFFMLLREPIYGVPVYQPGYWLLFLAAVLTLWSMFSYLRLAWPSLRPGVDKDKEKTPEEAKTLSDKAT